uniref:ATP synthase subunit a n=1 Tax=Amaurobius fenestralis TaxID=680006 RepID=A0A7M4C8U3_9ARAC|nr:ATP synthase F0 subunit 6 [Amaurobius fenestralis]
MMMNLFSVFDPTSIWGISLNWIIFVMIFMVFPMKYYMLKSNYSNFLSFIYMMVKKMFNEVAYPHYFVLSFLSIATFLYLIMINLLSLFPFIFSGSAHLIFTLSLGFVLWFSFFMMGWLKNLKMSAAHLVPEGSPMILSFLLVIIESISHLIRPFTLSIRLAANMMAGHLIIGLLASVSLVNMYSYSLSLIFQSLMLILEFGVCVIQGFVFSILLLLYALEYY